LRKLRPDYFKDNLDSLEFDALELYGSTLLDNTLNLSKNDFTDYLNALDAFWKELPENMY